MSDKFQFVKYSDSLISDIILFFRTVFNNYIDAEFYRWQNIYNPSGNSIIKLAVSKNNIIGHASLWLFNLKIFNDDILSGQNVNTMVHPDYRRMGLFELLSKDYLREGLEKDVQFTFRFPNQMALSAAEKKLDTVKICNIPQYIKILKGQETFSLFIDNRVFCRLAGLVFDLFRSLVKNFSKKNKDYEIRYIKIFNKEFDGLWQKEKYNYNIAINRTSEHLNWRYVKGPNNYKCIGVYKASTLIGYIIIKIQSKVAKNGSVVKIGYIVDMLCSRQHYLATRILLAEAEEYMDNEGACAVSCWMLKHVFYSGQLKRAGYVHFRSPVVFAGLIISNKLSSFKDELYNSKNWFVTSGDSDYL